MMSFILGLLDLVTIMALGTILVCVIYVAWPDICTLFRGKHES